MAHDAHHRDDAPLPLQVFRAYERYVWFTLVVCAVLFGIGLICTEAAAQKGWQEAHRAATQELAARHGKPAHSPGH